ncbi:hypothetical protein SAMN04488020_105254 [Palleronia marisminoris]|uniref:DUF995 domain-containing protein n=2 Tax=Palleronia marisminoris TaxID=315423 RepID=A0A1Y5SU28_9RHOB|nr:hypothetical protein SAMN04488020_105254 [Palleronia marisminoris]SLN48544.1 hypothetical protein PAM7066_02198 [Palleronia marisminoris]
MDPGAPAWQTRAMWRGILLIATLAAPAAAQDSPLDAEAFEAFTAGKTFNYSANGVPYGAEEYGTGRSVEWSFLDGECMTGRWYADGPDICFVYEDGPPVQCWRFYREGTGLRAEFLGGGGDTVLYSTTRTDEPLYCLGPEVGV